MASQPSNGVRGHRRGSAPRSSHTHSRSKSSASKEHREAGANAAAGKTSGGAAAGPEAALRSKYSKKLVLAKELFPEWSDEDLLATIDEAHGDLELAVSRITEGLAQQWSSTTKVKKPKRDGVGATPSSGPAEAGDRGGGRGATRGARGGRGGRGARGGGHQGTGRGGSRANGYGSHVTDAPAVDAATDVTSSYTPSTWEDTTPADTDATWADTVETPATSTLTSDEGWADTPAVDTTDAASWADSAPALSAPSVESGWGSGAASATATTKTASAAPKAPLRPSSRTIQPGTKFSWAQIAKPVDPPKPSRPTTELPQTTAQHEAQPVITIPDDQTIAEAAAAAPHQDPWASTPAAATEPWDARPKAGVGEGWAETVLATDNERTADKSSLPAAGIDPAGPIEMSASLPSQHEIPPSAITANLEAQAAQQQPQDHVNKHLESMMGPPGLSKRQTYRGDAAVIMPGEQQRGTGQAIDQANLQFGSLALYDGQNPSMHDPSKPLDHYQAQQSYAQTAAQQILPPDQRSGMYGQQLQEKSSTGAPNQHAVNQHLPEQQQHQHQHYPQAPQQQQHAHPSQAAYGGYQPFGGYQDPHSPYASSPYAALGNEAASYHNQHQSGQHQPPGPPPQQQPQSQQHPHAPQASQHHQSQYSVPHQAGSIPSSASPYQPFGAEYSQSGTPQQTNSGAEAQRTQASYDYYSQQYQPAPGYPRTGPEDPNKGNAPNPAGPYANQLGNQNQYAQYGYPYQYPMYGYGASGYYGGQQPGQPYAPQQQPAYGNYYAAAYNAPGRGAPFGAPGQASQASYGRGATSTSGSYQSPQGAPSPYGYAAPGGGYPGQPGQQQADSHRSDSQPQSTSYKDSFY